MRKSQFENATKPQKKNKKQINKNQPSNNNNKKAT